MPVINGVYLKDFTALPSSVTDANIIPIAITGDQVAYRTTVGGIVTDARITSKLLTGLSVTGATILATDTILQAFGKVQNQLNGKVSSVGLTMPAAFNVANSPITSAGTLAVTAAGVASQYIRGDGALADFPTTGGGGSSVSYYLNGSVSQGTFVGNTYYEMNKTPVIGTGTDFTIGADGYIAQFITDANDPASLLIPGGNWNVEMYFSASSSGGTPSFYVEVYKYNGTTFTLLGSSSATPEGITNGTAIDIYYTSVGISETVLTITDRLAIRVYVTHSGRTITLHTEDNHLSEIVTTFSNGLTTLNGLTKQAQYFAVGSTGTDFAIVSSVDTHTFNIPSASATNRGALSSADWTTFNSKESALTFSSPLVRTTNTISIPVATTSVNGYLSSTDWTTFNNKQGTITLTTTGTSGAATFSANTLNIPQYADSFVGTVTSVAALTLGTTGTDLSSTVANGTTTPVITLQVPTASATNRGALSSTDWTTFNNKAAALSGTINTIAYWDSSTTIASLALATYPSLTELSYVKGVTSAIQTQLNAKQATITLTTTGTSGAATFSANTLNIPQYQAAGTYVTSVTGTSPIVSSGGTTPAISIPVATTSVNGYLSSTDWTTFNNKTSNTGTVTSVGLSSATSGVTIGSTPVTTSGTITIAIATATSGQNGLLSSTDWSTFNSKQSTITLTTTGTSGAATFSANTLNIPNYGSALTGYLPLSGGTLTGALSGTSASFSSSVTATKFIVGTDLGYALNITTSGFGAILQSTGSSANIPLVALNSATSGGNNIISLQTDAGVERLAFRYDRTGDRIQLVAAGSGFLFTGAATFSSSVAINGSTVSTEGLSVQYNQAKTYTTQTAVSRWHSNEGVGSQFKLNLFAIGNATGSSRVFKFQTSNEGVANDGIIAFQSDGGNVGIGTSSPLKILHIAQGGNVNGILWTDDSAGNYRNEINNTYAGGTAASNLMTFKVSNGTTTGQTTVMNLTGAGNVGIGTTTPLSGVGFGLQITSPLASAAFVRTNYTGFTGLDIIQGGDGTGYLYLRDNTDLRFGTNNTLRLAIASTGEATFYSSVTASSLIKSGGTAAQYLMADGSTRTTSSNAYTLKDWYASGNNVSSTETDLMTYTVPANTLVNNGDKLSFTFGGIFGSVANSKTLRVYFGTTSVVLNSITEVNVGWQITGTIIKDSATTYRFTIVQTNINYYPYTMSGTSGTVTNYTGTNVFKITGQGTSSSDLTAQMGTLQFIPAG